jgi:hypothetical protein
VNLTTAITIGFGVLMLLLAICVGCVAVLRRRPGLRRRRQDPTYQGPPRRLTDSGSEPQEAFEDLLAPDNDGTHDGKRVNMNLSARNESTK